MKNATLRQFKVFEAVARLLSFSRAAEELHLSQPAVSRQISQLAYHAGLPLFEQVGRKIHLTPAGSDLVRYSRVILDLFREMEDAMARHKGITGGRLRVAVISAGDYFFPQLLAEFQRRNPGVALDLTVHNREELLHVLAENLTDLAVMVRPPSDVDTVNEIFAPHPYVIVAAPAHPLVARKRIPVATVAREPFITRERGSDTWNSMQETFRSRMKTLNIAMEIKSTETIKQAVIAGMGVSFLSAHTISLELETGRLAVLDVEGFPAMLAWYVVHRRAKHLPPVALAFKKFLIEDGAAQIERITRLARYGAKTKPDSAIRPRR